MEATLHLSVIIPTHNRWPVLRRVLQGLAEQDTTGFEVIVVDDASDDDTVAQLGQARERSPFPLRILRSDQRGAAAARNAGVAQARAGLILFLDDDTIPDPPLVRQHREAHRSAASACCVMGRISMSPELKQPQQIRWNELDMPGTALGTIEFRADRYRTANSSLPRTLFLAQGGFHPGLVASEDLEFALRLAADGVRFYYWQDIHAVHHHPMDERQYMDRGATYGRAVAYWHRISPDRRLELAARYGLYDAALPPAVKGRYAVKVLLINRLTVGPLRLLARLLRRRCFGMSDRLYRAAFGYYLRREFHSSFHHAVCVLGLYV